MKNIIIDTDIGNDCDDAGALAVALALEKKGRCKIRAVASSTSKLYAPAYLKAVKEENGADYDVLAIADGFDGKNDHYCKQVAEKLYLPEEEYLVGYQKLLQEKTTIISIGSLHGLNMIGDFSNVNDIYIMGGNFANEIPEFNIRLDLSGAREFLEKTETKLIFCPFELGEPVKTGHTLKEKNTLTARVYDIFTKGSFVRSSWDLITVYLGVEEKSPLFTLEQGTVTIDERGVTRFRPGKGNHYVAKLACSAEELERTLEELL